MKELELLQQKLTVLDEARLVYQSQLEGVAKEWIELFFNYLTERVKDIPDLLRLEWVQYTPYFNDGDECIFNVHPIDIAYLDPEEPISDYAKMSGKYQWKRYQDIQDEINTIIRKDYDLIQMVFGECAKVVFVKDCTEFDIDYNEHE